MPEKTLDMLYAELQNEDLKARKAFKNHQHHTAQYHFDNALDIAREIKELEQKGKS